MVDTHCHLWLEHFNNEIPAVIDRAKAAGVHTLICVGCDEESSRKSVELARQYENVYAAVGIHPTEASSGVIPTKSAAADARRNRLYFKDKGFLHSSEYGLGRNDKFRWIPDLIRSSKKVVAIGETGIDYYHEPFDPELQKNLFREQCLIAQEFNLPVIVHLRMTKDSKTSLFPHERNEHDGPHESFNAAEKACLEVLNEVGMRPGKVLFHCFSSDRRFAEAVLSRGWHLSFSGVITYPNATELREVVKMCPLDRMVVETDAPFLAPQSHRGERNEPAFVVETVRQIAAIKQISIEALEKMLDDNAARLFGIKP